MAIFLLQLAPIDNNGCFPIAPSLSLLHEKKTEKNLFEATKDCNRIGEAKNPQIYFTIWS